MYKNKPPAVYTPTKAVVRAEVEDILTRMWRYWYVIEEDDILEIHTSASRLGNEIILPFLMEDIDLPIEYVAFNDIRWYTPLLISGRWIAK